MRHLSILLFFLMSLPCWSVQIFVKYPDGRTRVYNVDSSNFIEEIKSEIEKRTAIPLRRQQLRYGGKELKNSKFFEEYSISEGSTLHLYISFH